MTRFSSTFAATATSLLALAATPALAAGTAAGTQITNSATISFAVNTISQSASATADTVTVDRVINMTMAEVGSSTTTVIPGQSRAAVAFRLTNTSNATLDFAFALFQLKGGVAAHGGTDAFDITNLGLFVDTNANGTYDSGTDATLTNTFFDEVPADAARTFFVVGDIPLGLANGAVAGVNLVVTADEGGTVGTSPGSNLNQTNGANTAGMDTVFADAAGVVDAARDALFSTRDDFTVSTAALTSVRTNMVISDPVNGTTNPKAIPGATVEYCLAISNGAGAPTATDVTIADTLAANLTYDNAFGIFQNGTVTGGVCDTTGAGAGTAGGFFATGKVNGTIASLAAGETKTIRYRAKVN